ncbi:lipocalin [Microbulbifer sp. SH-1]|uniref:lipocalin family protein n=1 Tax=Microbulbifer sp. SH-1 TaxID=2681547 RepID=UPI001408C1E0|nr:lipocalin family protein [Microbulbifer sp. SH-1]QIL90750.1 lipocalin [Microbulbifer sp. SH-1]
MRNFAAGLVVLLSTLVAGCTGVPEGVEPVDDFTLDRYLGRWYEIARLDHSFERGLSRVTAEYSLRDDGGVKVVNRGFDAEHARWKESVGKAFFVGEPNVGHLKVSFFGPFYGSYVIFELDDDYRHAMISGPDRSYLWLLSRTPTVDDPVKKRFIQRAGELGFDTGALIFVDQSPLSTTD